MKHRKPHQDLKDRHAHPTSAEEFAGLWKLPEAVDVLKGNEIIPNVIERQHRFVGYVLNMCILTHVYERLKAGASPESLATFFRKTSKQDIEKLFDSTQDDAQRLSQLLELSKRGKLLVQRDLVPTGVWKKFVRDSEAFEPDGLNEAPLDPRIKAGNDKIGETMKMYGKGAKIPTSILAKLKDRGCQLSMIRDINRIGILPKSPEYAQDFIHIVELLNPPKVIGMGDKGAVTIPQLFEESPEVFANGYYNQKIYIALDRVRKSREPTEGNVGTIAEIKVVPAAMHNADELTALIKPVRKQVQNYGKEHVIHGRQSAGNDEALERLRENYELVGQRFALELARIKRNDKNFKPDYRWPEFPSDINKSHMKLGEQLLRLAREIHRDAILHESREWREAYVTTYVKQELAVERSRKKKHSIKEPPRTDHLPNEWIDPIAASIHLDVAALKRSIVDQQQQKLWQASGNGKH